MEIKYQGEFKNLSQVENNNKEELNLPEGKYLFKVFVDKPSNPKIILNGIERDSIIVNYMDIVKWEISKEGYKTSKGEFQVINSIGFIISLEIQKKKRIKDPYIKWSVNNLLGYDYEIIDLSKSDEEIFIPDPDGKDNSFLYTKDNFLYWKKISPEFIFSPKENDSGKFISYSIEKGFSFSSPFPESSNDKNLFLTKKNGVIDWYEINYDFPKLPIEEEGNTQSYSLTCLNGNVKWKLNQFDLPSLPPVESSYGNYFLSYENNLVSWKENNLMSTWGNIKGNILDQNDLQLKFAEIDSSVNSLSEKNETTNLKVNELSSEVVSHQDWIENFNIEADGFIFEDGKIKYKPGFIFPSGEEFFNLKELVLALKNRYATFEKYVKAQLSCRATSPDYSQIEEVEVDSTGLFFVNKNYYLRLESKNVGDYIEVYRPLLSEDAGVIIGPDLSSPITTIYKNVSGEGDIRIIELTKGFYYKLSNKNSFNVLFIGELPFGKNP